MDIYEEVILPKIHLYFKEREWELQITEISHPALKEVIKTQKLSYSDLTEISRRQLKILNGINISHTKEIDFIYLKAVNIQLKKVTFKDFLFPAIAIILAFVDPITDVVSVVTFFNDGEIAFAVLLLIFVSGSFLYRTVKSYTEKESDVLKSKNLQKYTKYTLFGADVALEEYLAYALEQKMSPGVKSKVIEGVLESFLSFFLTLYAQINAGEFKAALIISVASSFLSLGMTFTENIYLDVFPQFQDRLFLYH